MILSNPWMDMYVEADGKRFKVRAICKTVEHANLICQTNPTFGVICEDYKSETIIVADLKPTA